VVLPVTLLGLRSCPNNHDWFTFDLSPGQVIQIDTSFTHSTGDIDMFLLDPSQSVVAGSTSVDDDERIVHTATVGGPHYLQVLLYQDIPPSGNAYSLTIVDLADAVVDLAGCGENVLPPNDDASSGVVPLPFELDFLGATHDSLFVNNNGNVTFDAPLSTFTPFGITDGTQAIIAPFFADVDTRGSGSALVTFGEAMYGGRAAFCANWVGVGYYNSHADTHNSFQLLLVDRSDVSPGDFDAYFNYETITWETGDASGGTNGLGGSSARAGYSNGAGSLFELPGSGVVGSFLDSSPSGLVHGSMNSNVEGRFIFEFR
jgi:hypothetical protein